MSPTNGIPAATDRRTLCLPGQLPGVAMHAGEEHFASSLERYYPSSESRAIEELLQLKNELASADTETFWARLMEGMTALVSAQYGFVAKRILRDDHNTAIEMPPLGAAGSCLLGTAFYYNDGKDLKGMFRDYKYLAFGAPCGYMKHDKVFLIPEKLSNFIVDNPNKLPFATEAYLGVPLFSEGRCFAHFGLMWSPEGLAQLNLSWGFVELLMHSLEDLILERLLRGESFAKPDQPGTETSKQVIPQELITASQSLKPYARGLSHELRTPMQGVVGMLDVMHATVQEAIDGQNNGQIRRVFQDLRENIEAVQDSSRRAVEAADNVVHAYDLDLQVSEPPEGINGRAGTREAGLSAGVLETRPSIFIEGNNTVSNPYKQKRRRSSPVSWHRGSSPKHQDTRDSPNTVSPRDAGATVELTDNSGMTDSDTEHSPRSDARRSSSDVGIASTRRPRERDFLTSSKQSRLRDIFHVVVNDGLLVGGRPDSTIVEEIEHGEKIEVHSRSSSGESSGKTITWSVDEDVPDILHVDERDLTKLISCVFLNAFKFTEAGSIVITATVPDIQKHVLVKVIDTGVGIPPEFQPRLFQAFSREDDRLTRTKEGLGLGLLVAKGLARKIGGDILCVRSETIGPNRGTEFDIKIPLSPGEPLSRAHSPFNGLSTPTRTSGQDAAGTPMTTSTPELLANVPTSPIQSVPRTARKRYTRKASAAMSRDMENGDLHRNSTSTASMLPPNLPNQPSFDKKLAEKHPLTFLVAEDNRINRKLLVQMLSKLGYKDVYEAFNGKEAVEIMKQVYDAIERPTSPVKRTKTGTVKPGSTQKPVDVILMDLWMPEMDGYEATQRIFQMAQAQADKTTKEQPPPVPTVLAVTADATDEALMRATQTGMEGFMTKPYKLNDLQRLISEFSIRHTGTVA